MLWTLPVLAQALDVPTSVPSLLWALPLCLSIALVYKALRVEPFEAKVYLREVALSFLTLIGFMLIAAVVLLFVHLLAR